MYSKDFILELSKHAIDIATLTPDDIIDYKEPVVESVKLESRSYPDVIGNEPPEIVKVSIDATVIISAYDKLAKQVDLSYSVNDVLFNKNDVFQDFILELRKHEIDIATLTPDDIIDYKEPEVIAVEKEEELSYPELEPNPVPETEKQVYDMSSVILAYNALNKITKLDYSVNDILFNNTKELGELDVWTKFVLQLHENNISIDNFNPSDLIEIEPETPKVELEGQTYPELKSNKELPDLSLKDPISLEKVVKAYNRLDKIATVGYARKDLLFNPEMDYGDITVWQSFIVDCNKHGIEL